MSVLTTALTSPLATGLLAAAEDGTWFERKVIQRKLVSATMETLGMTFVSGALTIVFGLLLGLALVSTGKRGQHRNRTVYEVLSQIVNFGRSMPFIILLVAIMSFTRFLLGTSIGWQAACVPLTVGAIPFYARLVETAIYDVDRGKVEAALMIGSLGAPDHLGRARARGAARPHLLGHRHHRHAAGLLRHGRHRGRRRPG